MNDRIDELLWQAGGFTKISNPNDSFLDGRYILTQEQLDMFSELIVNECSSIADGWVDNDDNGKNYPSTMIKRHFGVE